MADKRSAELQAAEAARLIHDRLDVRNRLVHRYGGLDVYRLAEDLDLPVIFRKLKGLLGFYMVGAMPGIAVTTERPPAIQRFTCAHEVGHHALEHASTLDDDSSIAFAGGSRPNNDLKELQANIFASHLLMPLWLLNDRAKDLLKAGLRIPDPIAVYQLSLRLGTSYQATVNTLSWRRLITQTHRETLLKVQPKQIKRSLLKDYEPDHWKRDVWLLSPLDDGEEVQAHLSDVIVMRVPELASSGYVNEFRDIGGDQTTLIAARTEVPADAQRDSVGGALDFYAVANLGQEGAVSMEVRQRRPWEPEESASRAMHLSVDVSDHEHGGLAARSRARRLKEVATRS